MRGVLKPLALVLGASAQVFLTVLFYWMGARGVVTGAHWRIVMFGVPFVMALALYWMIFGAMTGGIPISWRKPVLALLALTAYALFEWVGLYAAFNLFGT
jgi:hypothetical protein